MDTLVLKLAMPNWPFYNIDCYHLQMHISMRFISFFDELILCKIFQLVIVTILQSAEPEKENHNGKLINNVAKKHDAYLLKTGSNVIAYQMKAMCILPLLLI